MDIRTMLVCDELTRRGERLLVGQLRSRQQHLYPLRLSGVDGPAFGAFQCLARTRHGRVQMFHVKLAQRGPAKEARGRTQLFVLISQKNQKDCEVLEQSAALSSVFLY
jgi:hypothetical protein